MGNIYLIDYENVGNSDLQNMKYLRESDEVVLFHSDNACVSQSKLNELESSTRANISCEKVFLCGKDSLDFQLVAYLGYKICEIGKDATYYIVSRDKGYHSVILFFKSKANIYQIPKILLENKVTLTMVKSNNSRTIKEKQIKQIKNELNKSCIKEVSVNPQKILDIMDNSKDLSSYHNNIIKEYNENTGLEIYKKSKKLYNLFTKITA